MLIHVIINCIYCKNIAYPQEMAFLNNLKRFIYDPI